MFRRLINWLRPIRCKNFECLDEWDGICYAKKLKMSLYDPDMTSSLVCLSFKQVRGD